MKKSYILYIEDEEFQAKLFSKIIEDEIGATGHKVFTLKNGEDALDFFSGKKDFKIKREDVGLVLLDLAIYDISGFQILKEITKSKSGVPVAILSAREDEKTKKEAKKLGADDYFIKGKDLAELNRLREFIVKNIR